MTSMVPLAPQSSVLGDLLFEIAGRDPAAPMVFLDGEVVSYGEVLSASTRLAAGLANLGVSPGDRVGVLFGNQPEWIISAFACWLAGTTVVPINTWYRSREIEEVLVRCAIDTVVSVDRFLNQDYREVLEPFASQGLLQNVVMTGEAPSYARRWRDVLAPDDPDAQTLVEARRGTVSPDSIAYVLFTSGSSARPKGVQLAHDSLVTNGYRVGQRRRIVSSDRIWLGAPLFYSLGAANAFPMALAHGASLVLQGFFSASGALSAIERHQATVYYGTGNMTKAILADSSFSRKRVASLSRGLAGLSPQYKRLTLTELGVAGATPSYGLTETYGHVTGGDPDDPIEIKLATEGRPLPGIEIVIVDPTTARPLPAGNVGKVLIGGLRYPGYLEEAEMSLTSDGLLDSGDLGSLDEEGRLIYHSRVSDVLKVGGINVSPLDVQELLLEHPEIEEAHVVGHDTPEGGQELVAFIVAQPPELTADQVRKFMRELAASYKVPTHVVIHYEDFPRLASGKVNVTVLRESLSGGAEMKAPLDP